MKTLTKQTMIKKLLTIIALATSSLSYGQKVVTSGQSTYIICGDSVRSFGSNYAGQLGHGNTIDLSLPKTIHTLSGIIDVSASGAHVLFLKNDGTVWACGVNSYGQLGTGNTYNVSTPVQIPGLNNVTAISAGGNHSLFLKSDSTVWVCGYNFYGQLGLGDNTNRHTPTQLTSLQKYTTAISAGFFHSLFLTKYSIVYASGMNSEGQLGNGTTTDSNIPVLCNNTIFIKAISAGVGHSLFLNTSGKVLSCGANANGELGISNNENRASPTQITSITNVTKINAGSGHSMFLKNDSTVWACGYNSYGQLGLESPYKINTPIQVPGLNKIIAISAGKDIFEFFNFYQRIDGKIFGCGFNKYGQFGNGEFRSSHKSPTQMPDPCAVPTPPQSSITINGSGSSSSICQGSDVNISCTTVGSNPDMRLVLDNTINLNNPIAIDKNSHAVFVLNNNNSVTAYNFDGTVYKTYPNLSLSNIWAFTVDDNDNLYINNGSVDGNGYLQIHKCDNTGTLISSIPNLSLGASNLITDLVYYNQPGYVQNLYYSDTLAGQAAVNFIDMNDPNYLTNSGAIYLYNKHYTSLSMDNVYGDKRLLMADPINHVLEGVPMFNNQGETPMPLVDSASTAGMALDYIYADTLINPDAAVMMVSSRTTGIVGLASSNLAPDGSITSQIDTSFTSMFNAVSPVGAVLVKRGNLTEYWVADNGQNKLLRLSLYNYNITPTLPAGLTFNAVKGVIEGTPKVITAPQTYTLSIYYGLGGFGSSTSTFTLGVTSSSGVSNTAGAASATANQPDGTTKNYIDAQNCTQLVVITDFAGGTSPGLTQVTQTVASTGTVAVGNKNFVRRVTSVQAQQTENLNVKLKFFYTYEDVKEFNLANPTYTLTNDTVKATNPGRSMPVAMLHMHDSYDTINSNWVKNPTFYQSLFALWNPSTKLWELNVPVLKLSEFYMGPPSVATGFNCANSGKDTIIANDYYVWPNSYDTLFTSGDYVDTLVNHTGCDSVAKLHLTINITTGLNQAALASGISVYPNPSNGVFNIRFNNAVVMPSKVRVIDVLGNEVLNKTISSNDTIDLSAYQSGIYYLMLESEGATKTWRIVKQ